MSWLSGIAGKAEDLLNKMDQTAATVLNETKTKTKKVKEERGDTLAYNTDMLTIQPPSYRSGSTPYVPSNPEAHLESGLHSRNSSISSSFSTISTRELAGNNGSKQESLKDDEEKLFEFLNTKECSTLASTPQSTTPPRSESIPEEVTIETVDSEKPKSGRTTPVNERSQESVKDLFDSVKSTNEDIMSLTKQIGLLTKRNVELETECKRVKKRLENWQNQVSSSDGALRELQARETDLKATIDAKNSQLAVLRVRLQETDELLRSKQGVIDGLEAENKALREERQLNDSNYGENLEGLRERLKSLEEELIREKETLRENQTESMKQIGKYEEKQDQLVNEIANLQRALGREKAASKEMEKKLTQIQTSFTSLETDFSEYKTRAQKTLQAKEDLIKALQAGTESGTESQLESEATKFNKVLESQCDAMVMEIEELRQRNDGLRKELDRLNNEEIFALKNRISVLMDELEDERSSKRDLEQELRQSQEEVRYLMEDLNLTKTNLNARIKDRVTEIEKLRKQLMAKRNSSSNGTSVEELEKRVKNLTENLIQKQTLVEQLSSERHSLVLQLERCEERLKEALEASVSPGAYSNPGSVTIGMVHSSSAHNLVNRVRPLVEENPFDGQVTRRVKRAYGQLDSFSIRLGMFLRAYPSARALVILYIMVLHIWVFFILFTYRPEIH